MNVLLYVIVMIMILTSLTYAKLESYRSFAGLEAGFNHYMNTTERMPLDAMNQKMYDSVVVGSKAAMTRASANSATSRLSLYYLLKKDEREKSQDIYQQSRDLFKQLIMQLYGRQPFLKEHLLENPNFLNEILDEIQVSADNDEKLTLKNAAVLSKLEFKNSQLQFIFYLMLHGLPNHVVTQDAAKIDNNSFIIADGTEEEFEDEAVAKAESDEALPVPGYASLMDYVTVKKAPKVRVFLASRPLLTAIFGSDDVVDSILEARQNLYSQVKNKAITKEQASDQFKNNFSQQGTAVQYPAILDFSVTNTNPLNYR